MQMIHFRACTFLLHRQHTRPRLVRYTRVRTDIESDSHFLLHSTNPQDTAGTSHCPCPCTCQPGTVGRGRQQPPIPQHRCSLLASSCLRVTATELGMLDTLNDSSHHILEKRSMMDRGHRFPIRKLRCRIQASTESMGQIFHRNLRCTSIRCYLRLRPLKQDHLIDRPVWRRQHQNEGYIKQDQFAPPVAHPVWLAGSMVLGCGTLAAAASDSGPSRRSAVSPAWSFARDTFRGDPLCRLRQGPGQCFLALTNPIR